jgi:hypothetical protein
MVTQSLKDQAQVMLVFLWICTSDEQVVNIGVTERETTQNLIDEALERLCCISQSKWHSKKFKQTKWCCNSSLVDI